MPNVHNSVLAKELVKEIKKTFCYVKTEGNNYNNNFYLQCGYGDFTKFNIEIEENYFHINPEIKKVSNYKTIEKIINQLRNKSKK